MLGPQRVWFLNLTLVAAAGCADVQVREGGPASARPGSSTPAGGGGFTLPEPAMVSQAADAAAVQCAAEAHKAEIVPLDLMLLVDSSGSMGGQAGTRTKWETAQSALRSFISDPKSAGLGVGLQFFPRELPCLNDGDCSPGATSNGRFCTSGQVCAGPNGPAPTAGTCGPPPLLIFIPPPQCPTGTTCQPLGYCTITGAVCTNLAQPCPMMGGTCEAPPKTCAFGGAVAECEEARYQAPAVDIQALPVGQDTLTRTLNRKLPNGGTPMGPAVRGVLNHLRAHLQANPGRKVALILASDGLPVGCQRNDIASVTADVTAAFMGSPSIPTYVIGVFAANELTLAKPALDALAMGGGTNLAFVFTATDDLNMRLLEALDQIRGAALACEYRIPISQSQSLDFGKVNVRFTSAAGPENIPYVERVDRCDPARGGWYYDIHPSMGNPGRVVVCPATCDRFKADRSAQVDLVFGCATRAID